MAAPTVPDAPAPAALTIELQAGERRAFRLSCALGERGLRLEHPAPFPPGSTVEVSFVLPRDDAGVRARVRALGRLVALGEAREEGGEAGALGITLEAMPDADRRAITRYVTSRLRAADST